MSLVNRYLRKYRHRLEAATSVWILFSLLFLVSVLTILLFLISISRQHITDEPYALTSVPPSVLAEAVAAGREVKAGLAVRNFLVFDMTANNFVFEGVVWFDVDSADVDLSKIGQFSFDRGEVLARSEPERHGSRYLFGVKVRLQSNLRYESFPLDDHRLDIVLRNSSLTFNDVVLTSADDQVVLSPGANAVGWRLLQASARGGSSTLPLAKGVAGPTTPEVLFSFSFKRVGLRRLFIIFVPLFSIFFLGLSSLTLDPTQDFQAVLALAVGSLTALVFYELVVGTITPQVDYFTVSDQIYTLLLIIATVIFCLQIVLLHHYTKWRKKTSLPDVLQFVHTSSGIIRGLTFILALMMMWLCLIVILP